MSDTISVLELLENSIRNNESEKVQLFLINSLKATLSNKTSVPKSIAFSEKEPLDLDKPIPYFPVESNPIPYSPVKKKRNQLDEVSIAERRDCLYYFIYLSFIFEKKSNKPCDFSLNFKNFYRNFSYFSEKVHMKKIKRAHLSVFCFFRDKEEQAFFTHERGGIGSINFKSDFIDFLKSYCSSNFDKYYKHKKIFQNL